MRAGRKVHLSSEDVLSPEANGFDRGVRVILFGGIVSCWGVAHDFEVLRCQDASCLAELSGPDRTSVLLVDMELLSDSNRSQLVEHIGRLNAPLAIALSDSTDDQTCEQLLRIGVVGLLRRDESPETLGRAISAVVDGQLWFPRGTISRVLKEFLIPTVNHLTAREMEILMLIGGGLNNQQIADRLFISRETVRWHLRSLYPKLGIRSRRSAIEYFRLLGGSAKAMPAQSAVNGKRHSRAAS
jgi:DNA-binding NarL/FixJ family response regulator